MKKRCVLGTLMVFGGGLYAGLCLAAQLAEGTGRPMMQNRKTPQAAGTAWCGERVADALEQVARNMEPLRQDGTAGEPRDSQEGPA
ncbi:hypothetical protein ACFV42_23675 [Streptomyces solisilvae]|uniref:hypothetical protein n=1 Tax=Streptomyces malaysiensis TaxID=92644 RepID=UPI003685BB7C